MKSVQGELKWTKTGDDKAALKSQPMATEEGAIAYGDQKITEIKTSVQSTMIMIDEAEKVGTQTAAQLVSQGQQLQTVSDNLYEIEDTLQRATAITRRMARKVMTDKYVWVLTVLIILAIIAIIALKATGKSVSGKSLNNLFIYSYRVSLSELSECLIYLRLH
jgi:hypothetical protein